MISEKKAQRVVEKKIIKLVEFLITKYPSDNIPTVLKVDFEVEGVVYKTTFNIDDVLIGGESMIESKIENHHV